MEIASSKVLVVLIFAVVIGYFFYVSNTTNKQALLNLQEGKDFLERNKSIDGVIETPSGLQYIVISRSNDSKRPTLSDSVLVHYHGTLIDGTVFDSSIDRGEPISFVVTQVISGWTEGLQLMSVGDKFRFFIPPSLAYGERNAGKIGPNTTLIFDVELLDINP